MGIIAGFQNIAVVRNPIQQRGAHLGTVEDLNPFPKIEVGGDDQRSFIIQLADQVEQQSPTGCKERQVTEFINDNSIHDGQLLGQIAGFALLFFLVQLIDQIHRVIESHAFSLVNRRYGQSGCQMGLAGSGAPTRIKL
jgi:hypothetical protein